MPKKKSNISIATTMRLTEGLREFIEDDVRTYQIHRDRSDWIMCAIIRYMDFRIQEEKDRKENRDQRRPN